MVNVIGVRFPGNGKMFFFDPVGTEPKAGSFVLVETTKGTELAEVCMEAHSMDEARLRFELKPILRLASEGDLELKKKNEEACRKASEVCLKKIEEHRLEMKLVRVEQPFDCSKIIFYFTANGRVDFRALVKDLASAFKMRIELRQIGVRDEARFLGGLGTCGRPICCDAFLNDFQPVSIKMAKEQKLSLNPTKISGVCGRLMCCLKYEEDQYEEIHKRMPKVGKEIRTPDGTGTVIAQNTLRESVTVRFTLGENSEIREYTLETLFPDSAKKESAEPARDPDQDSLEPVLQHEEDPVPDKETADESVTEPKQVGVPEETDNPDIGKDRSRKRKRVRRRENPSPAPAPGDSHEPQSAVSPAGRVSSAGWMDQLEKAMQAAQIHTPDPDGVSDNT